MGTADARALPQLGDAAVSRRDLARLDALSIDLGRRNVDPNNTEVERARRVKRSAILLGLVAFGFYLAFILMSVLGFRQ